MTFLKDQKAYSGKAEGKKGRKVSEPKARKTNGERKVRHQSRVMKVARKPKVKEGQPLDDDPDERSWLDW
jgi:hypothetical protein